eukprot:scaffold492_cov99-Amphora_coffeaeformis.AAC.3
MKGSNVLRLYSVVAQAWTIAAFVQQRPLFHEHEQKQQRHQRERRASALFQSSSSSTDAEATSSDSAGTLDVVLFGIGDLRTDDHGGLTRALATTDNPTAALLVLDEMALTNLPGIVAHTADTVQLLLAAVDDLAKDLKATYNLNLRVVVPQKGVSVVDVVQDLLPQADALTVHAQDLGDADNQMGYGPYAQFLQTTKAASDNDWPDHVTVKPWTMDLRTKPWEDVTQLPDSYTDYRAKYLSENPTAPLDVSNNKHPTVDLTTGSLQSIFDDSTAIDAQAFVDHVVSLLHLDPDRVQAEVNTGLYMTHWGGLRPETVGGRAALDILRAYVIDARSDDQAWTQHALYPGRACRRNGRSLEHASMQWQLRGSGDATPTGDIKEWLQGEPFLRYVAAPLLLGTLSPRRAWHTAAQHATPRILFDDPLQTMMEAREWHRLRAAHNIQTDPMYNKQKNVADNKTSYRYWRYHGFLCRYAVTEMEHVKEDKTNKQRILLVHGFGASGAQWNKAMAALSDGNVFFQGLAPDLLGFGESEKPAISYTAYMWDAFVGDFVKERALGKVHQWESFVLGGNSIGGFTSMSAAASDCAPIQQDKLTVTSSGAPGTGQCKGLVLMNSAGPVQTRDEVQAMLQQSANNLEKSSVAQITALDALPPCSPPPRPVARAFGNVLLTYLRPNIQSICKNLYPTNPAAVDDSLCQGILRDSLDPGAINVMMAGAKLPSPRSANELLQADFRLGQDMEESSVRESSYNGPVLVAQGVLDPLNDAMDRMNRLGALREGIAMSPIQAGHCPHDELPEEVAQSISRWAIALAKTENRAVTTATK